MTDEEKTRLGLERLKKDAQESYDQKTLKPMRSCYLDPRGGCGCAVGAAYLAHNTFPTTYPAAGDIREWAESHYGLPNQAISGIIVGFDEPTCETDWCRPIFRAGFEVGQELHKQYITKKVANV